MKNLLITTGIGATGVTGVQAADALPSDIHGIPLKELIQLIIGIITLIQLFKRPKSLNEQASVEKNKTENLDTKK